MTERCAGQALLPDEIAPAADRNFDDDDLIGEGLEEEPKRRNAVPTSTRRRLTDERVIAASVDLEDGLAEVVMAERALFRRLAAGRSSRR